MLNISKSRTTAYHPQCDGLVERFNRTLQDMLATTVKDHPFDWEEALPKVCMAYNSSVHAATGYTPFYLMFGREARLPLDLVYGTMPTAQTGVNDYASHLRDTLEDAYEHVRKTHSTVHGRRKEVYDRHVHGEPYQKNDIVWLFDPVVKPGHSKKLRHPWTGPYQVLDNLSDTDYRIKPLQGKKSTIVVHFNRLKPCVPGTRFDQQFGQEERNEPEQSAPSQELLEPVGTHLEIVDSDDDVAVPTTPQDTPRAGTENRTPAPADPNPARYPTRERHPPDRYATTVLQ